MSNLGLPLEYQTLPEFFDSDNGSDTGDWATNKVNSLIDEILSKNNVRSILDMTCGTGSQVLYLDSRGYSIIGSDFSAKLVESAIDKANALGRKIEFIHGDMRTVKLGKFDAVITIFNAVGHLTQEDFSHAMLNINDNLNPGGIYLFDIFNIDALNDEIVATFPYQRHVKVGEYQMLKSQCSTLDRENNLLISYDHVMVQKSANPPDLYENNFSLRIYTIDELKQMLNKNGFEILSVYGIDGSEFSQYTTTSMLIVAKKTNYKR